jgi:hypothetical protein
MIERLDVWSRIAKDTCIFAVDVAIMGRRTVGGGLFTITLTGLIVDGRRQKVLTAFGLGLWNQVGHISTNTFHFIAMLNANW